MEKNNPITATVGTLFEIWEQLAQLNSDLHISKVSIFINNLNNALQDLKNDELFPILEFKPYYHGEDEDRITNISFFIYFRGLNNETPPHSFTIKSNPKISFILKMFSSLELSSTLMEYLDTEKLHSTFSLQLDYNEISNREKIMESLLDSKQLLKSRTILLEDELKTKETIGSKIKSKI